MADSTNPSHSRHTSAQPPQGPEQEPASQVESTPQATSKIYIGDGVYAQWTPEWHQVTLTTERFSGVAVIHLGPQEIASLLAWLKQVGVA